MRLTDEEIRQILIKKKRKEAMKKRFIRRLTLLIVLLLVIITGVGFFIHSLNDKEDKKAEQKAPKEKSRGIVFIDPAHGGVDGGTDDYGRLEKDDNLKLALKVRDYLEQKNFTVIMSREDDLDMDSADRVKVAQEKDAQILVSLHRNQVDGRDASGVEVWISADNPEDDQLLGKNILDALVANGFESRDVRPGTLVDETDNYDANSVSGMPSCLVEVGFVSSKSDNKLFDSKLNENAKGIANAIDKTFKALYETKAEEEKE